MEILLGVVGSAGWDELASFAEGPSDYDSCQNILIQTELILKLF